MKQLLPFLLLLTPQVSFGQWITQDIQTSEILTGVHFRNDDTGFTCGWNRIFKTVNGGEDWILVYTGSVGLTILEDIKTFGNNLVIAVGGDLNGGPIILRSTNGGVSWTAIPAPSGAFLKNIFFLDNLTVFACGSNGTILRSTDGGLHWIRQTSGTDNDLQSIVCLDDQNAFAVGGRPGVATLITTNDGGDNWQEVDINTTSNLQSIYFTNPQTGYIVGWDGGIFKTTDGGANWIEQLSVNMQGNLEVFFTDDNTGYIVGGDINFGSIQKTINGGALWTEIGPGTSAGLVGVHFPSPNIGYTVGSNGTVLKTANGGVSTNTPFKNTGQLQCFPSPVLQTLTVKASDFKMQSIQLYNNSGALIKTVAVDAHQVTMDFSTFPAGNYYVVAAHEKGLVTSRITKL